MSHFYTQEKNGMIYVIVTRPQAECRHELNAAHALAHLHCTKK